MKLHPLLRISVDRKKDGIAHLEEKSDEKHGEPILFYGNHLLWPGVEWGVSCVLLERRLSLVRHS